MIYYRHTTSISPDSGKREIVVMKYYLGLDIGSSKTHALIADESGQTVGAGLSGPGNHQTVLRESPKMTYLGLVLVSPGMIGLQISRKCLKQFSG
jgi:hypothetical protein